MRFIKPTLIISGIILTLELFFYSFKLNSIIKTQRQSINDGIKYIKIDTTVLKEYKNSFALLQQNAGCKSTIDSMINKSKFLK